MSGSYGMSNRRKPRPRLTFPPGHDGFFTGPIEELTPYQIMKQASQLRAIKATAHRSPKVGRDRLNELTSMIGEHGEQARSQRAP